ncbi:hypothetical protein V8G54_037228 [Vigna mungo]|uniref:Uncharacterized protein n=1 Tax=Vigna mungo TaxID=3915 RepID=A0AAQ3MIP5_VIGMU
MICYYVLVLIMVLDSVTCISFPTYSSTGPTPLAGWMSNPTTVAHPAVSGGAIGLGAPSISVWDLSACSMPFQVAFLTLFVDYQTLRTVEFAMIENKTNDNQFRLLLSKIQIDAHVGGVNDLAFSHPNKQLCVITCGDHKTIKINARKHILELVSLLLQVQDLGYHLEFLHTSTILVYGLLKYCGWDVPVRNIFSCTDSVETLMSETHELGGSAVVVDRATPKARVFIFYNLSFYTSYPQYREIVRMISSIVWSWRVFCVKFSGDESYVISGRDDTNLRIWKAKASKQLGIFSCFLYNIDLGEVINV